MTGTHRARIPTPHHAHNRGFSWQTWEYRAMLDSYIEYHWWWSIPWPITPNMTYPKTHKSAFIIYCGLRLILCEMCVQLVGPCHLWKFTHGPCCRASVRITIVLPYFFSGVKAVPSACLCVRQSSHGWAVWHDMISRDITSWHPDVIDVFGQDYPGRWGAHKKRSA